MNQGLFGGSTGLRALKSINLNTDKIGMLDGVAITSGLVPGMNMRIISGNTESTSVVRTVSDGLSAGERLSFNRTAQTLAIASTDANDNISGTGARVVLIIYINTDGDEKTQVAVMNGQTKVTIGNDIQCINRLILISGGSGNTNAGDIWVGEDADTFTAGKPDNNLWGVMATDNGISNMAWHMIEKNTSSITLDMTFSSDSTSKNDGLIINLLIHNESSGVILKPFIIHLLQYTRVPGISIPTISENNVLEFTTINSSGTNAVTVICQSVDVNKSLFPLIE